MKNVLKLLWVVILLAVVLSPVLRAERDDDEDEHEGRHRQAQPVPAVYTESCGDCHVAYPAAFLPSGSWTKLVAGSADHFGVALDLKDKQQQELLAYLTANAADKARSEKGRKIMRSLNGATPLRITEVPYIRGKHRKLSDAIFARESIGSRSNCAACHTTAAQGRFDDDNVRIPKK